MFVSFGYLLLLILDGGYNYGNNSNDNVKNILGEEYNDFKIGVNFKVLLYIGGNIMLLIK